MKEKSSVKELKAAQSLRLSREAINQFFKLDDRWEIPMLHDFTLHLPTKIYFGKDSLSHLGGALAAFGPRVLLVYGKSSAKRIGLYDAVMKILKEEKKEVFELSGVSPNPRYSEVLRGARLVKENKIHLILAVGGGSVIDCAKAVSVCAYCRGDAWEKYWVKQRPLENKVVPVGAVLTLAGTGSEMNAGAVITHEDSKIKECRVFPSEVCPRFSILNPVFTYSLSRYQMSCGIFDALSHMMEQYFSGKDDNTTDYILEGLMESLIRAAHVALKEPTSYEARSNIMWCATMALNSISGASKAPDFQVHALEHQLSADTDCAHGAGLAAISIPYYRYICLDGVERFARFATRVMGVTAASRSESELALLGIERLENFIRVLELPLSLKALGATEETLDFVVKTVELGGAYRFLSREELHSILRAAYDAR